MTRFDAPGRRLLALGPALCMLLVCAGLLWPAGAAVAAEPRRIALVVGNARYAALPLNNPENDARVVASTLRQLGFAVTEHVNLPVKDFRRVLREYARRLQNDDSIGVFYYAGHGVQIDGRNYLLPVDINLRDEEEVKDEAVDVDELFISRLEHARAQVRIVILDACRDNPFTKGRTRNVRTAGGLAEMAARGALIAYASAPGATAEDGPAGTNSVYTRHLVKEMLAEGLEVEQMFKNVRIKVLQDTKGRQVPWVNTSMTRDFSFNPRRGPAAGDGARREEIARLQERLDQREAEQKKLEEDLQRRLKKLQEAEAGQARTRAPSGSAPTASPPAEKAARPAAPAAATARSGPNSERCVALLIRAQLGEPLLASETAFLQKSCR